MAESTIQAFKVTTSRVTFKNLTIKNINYINNAASYGGAIYFSGSGKGIVTNCNFINNTASGTISFGVQFPLHVKAP